MDLIATIIKMNCGDNLKFLVIANVAMESIFYHHVFMGSFSDNFLAFILTNETNNIRMNANVTFDAKWVHHRAQIRYFVHTCYLVFYLKTPKKKNFKLLTFL